MVVPRSACCDASPNMIPPVCCHILLPPRVLVHLPQAGNPRRLTTGAPPSTIRGMAGETILLVEDSDAVALGLRYGLEKEGFRVVWAATAGEARRQLESAGP